jgi:hypothetical protein
MRTIKKRLEGHQGGNFSAWLKLATDEELETRIRELTAIILGCEPWEVTKDLTDEELTALALNEP